MAELADAFVVLPGGFGTLEEMMEIVTWHQLGFHNKPIGLLNIDGFYDAFLQFLDHLEQEVSMKLASESLCCCLLDSRCILLAGELYSGLSISKIENLVPFTGWVE